MGVAGNNEKSGASLPLRTANFRVEGLSCASCVARVEKKALSIHGVKKATVNLLANQAELAFDEKVVSESEIAAQITHYGYKTTPLSGIGNGPARNGQGTLESDADPIRESQAMKLAEIKREFLLSLFLTLPLVAQMFFPVLGVGGTLQLLLSSIVQFYLGKRFYISSVRSLKTLTPNMDVLVSLGTTAAWGLSVYYLWGDVPMHQAGARMNSSASSHHYYFETSSVVITFMLLGKWLEQKARQKTGDALNALQSLVPERVTVVWEDGRTESKPLSSVLPPSRFRVKNGERVPLDGVVISGYSSVNESLVTGESLPVSKSPGDKICAGSLILEGTITAQCTSDAKGSTMGRIVTLVEHAQASKPPIQKLVDRICAVFVPVVMVIALATFAFWWGVDGDVGKAILNAVSVLVIACPCALGLATPSAIVVGIGEAAKNGILIRDSSVLEMAHRLTHVLLDKTGTLTEGKPLVTSLQVANPEHESLLYTLSSQSSHPLSKALQVYLESKRPHLKRNSDSGNSDSSGMRVVNLAGRGVLGLGESTWYFFGNLKTLVQGGFDAALLHSTPFSHMVDKARQSGASLSLLVAVTPQSPLTSWEKDLHFKDVTLLGMVSFEDRLKSQSISLISELKRRNLKILLITGDNPFAASSMAQKLGLDTVQSEALPSGKLQAIQDLQKHHQVVAMVGDGVNDSPALSAADLSIAFASGSDTAVFSAGMTLLEDNPLLVIQAIDIAKKTYSKIRQNLFWAFCFNVLAIPLAAAGRLNPALAGAVMGLSSFLIVTNSLRLKNGSL